MKQRETRQEEQERIAEEGGVMKDFLRTGVDDAREVEANFLVESSHPSTQSNLETNIGTSSKITQQRSGLGTIRTQQTIK